MDIDLTALPDNVAKLQEIVRALAAERANLSDAQAEIERLRLIIRKLQRSQFGRRAERLDDDQLHLGFEDLNADLGRVEARLPSAKTTPSEVPAERPSLPGHLAREDIRVDLERRACPCCGGDLHAIGDTVSEMLDYVPARLQVIRICRPRYGCRACGTIHQAPAPDRPIAKGLASPALLAHILTAKYCDHLPLYRQSQIFARHGVELDRSTLANWVGGAVWWLEPLHARLAEHVFASSTLFADDTPIPVLDPGRGRTKTGRLWVYARDARPWNGPDPPAAVYLYSPDRRSERPASHLSEFTGIVQVDGYPGFERLCAGGKIRLAACWAHARRKFYEVHEATGSPVAAEALRRIAELYAIEAAIRGHSSENRRRARQNRSSPLVGAMKLWFEQQIGRVPPRGAIADAIRYTLARWDSLCLFLNDGRIELDNNTVERAIRPIALGRKNHLFAGSDGGAARWAVVASLMATAKLNGVEPFAYLKDVLQRGYGPRFSPFGKTMPFFGNILPTLRSYSGSRYGTDGKVTIDAQQIVLGMSVPLTLGHRLEALGSSAVGHALSAGRDDENAGKLVRAAQYVRMSTEHQKYSTENQAEAMHQYAVRRGIEIVRTYADEGKSGLSLEGRDALKQLIEDVQTKRADFSIILVYDISRWGRFQDADESAYYEYICKRAGISVHYCAEQFDNDGSPVSTIVKGVKRAMAGEYSRELSVKVFTGQCRLIELGYRQGGPPGYGLRRSLIDQTGTAKGELSRGEHKSIQTDRVVLVPGPPEEIETVRWIYRSFVKEGKLEREIANSLNERAIPTDLGRPWTRGTVHQVLINEKYIGNNVWNRGSFKLKRKRVRNTPEMWIRAEGAFEPIVAQPLFDAAQAIIRERSHKLSNDEMVAALQELLQHHGYLSGLIIDEAERLPSSSAYQTRFGSLLRAYELVGFTPHRDYRYIEINRALRRLHPRVVADVIAGIKQVGGCVNQDPTTDLLTVNEEFTASIVVVRSRATPAGSLRWQIRFDVGLWPDITVAVRMDEPNESALDYYLLPRIDMTAPLLRLAEDNGISLDAYRFDTLEAFFGLAARAELLEVA